jgi:hypothetical protein
MRYRWRVVAFFIQSNVHYAMGLMALETDPSPNIMKNGHCVPYLPEQ